MQALQEITQWPNTATPNHVYLLEGTTLRAYVRSGTTTAHWFRTPIPGFSRSHRQFQPADMTPFAQGPISSPRMRTVTSSRAGVTYEVNMDTGECSCAGYQYRSTCRHSRAVIPCAQ